MRGVDVHGDKGPVDWARVRAAGFGFVFLKATEGKTFDDARFAFNRRAARAAGLLVGAYHFARPDNNTPAAEAAHFLGVHRPARGDLLPVLDWETKPATASWALEFLRIVEREIGAAPIFYTYADFLRQTGSFEALRRYPLWYASYGQNDGGVHAANPPQGFKFAIHQFTSKGRADGIGGDVDVNLLKLGAIDSLVYAPGGETPRWDGKFDFHAGGERVAVGNLRDQSGGITAEGKTWVEAVRARGGRGSVTPHQEESPGLEPEAEDLDPPANPEGDAPAGRWAEGEDREDLEREDFE